MWQVVGGLQRGLLVRRGPQLDAEEELQRLQYGALVKELELQGQRLKFQLLAGHGPSNGWVTLHLKGRDLLQPIEMPSRSALVNHCEENGIQALISATDLELYHMLLEMGIIVSCQRLMSSVASLSSPFPVATASSPSPLATALCSVEQAEERGAWLTDVIQFDAYVTDPYRLFGLPYDATDAMIKSSYRKMSLKLHPDRCPGDEKAAAKFRQLTAAKDFLLDPYQRRAFNEVNGFLTPTVNVAWWSDWDDIFSEIAMDEVVTTAPASPASGTTGTRSVDVLLLGATGITGTLACMVASKANQSYTWAMAGRDGRKLLLLQKKFANASFRGTMRIESNEDHNSGGVGGNGSVHVSCVGNACCVFVHVTFIWGGCMHRLMVLSMAVDG
eukprot:symbB.v1.2.015008.t1/scaffold1111.1/size137250/2